LILLALTAGGYWGYHTLRSVSVDDAEMRQAMAAQIACQAARAMPLPEGRPLLAVAPLAGDYRQLLTGQLRTWLARQNAVVVDLDWWEPLVPPPLRDQKPLGPAEACRRAAGRGIPFVVAGHVEHWVTDPQQRWQLAVEIQLIDTQLETILYRKTFELPAGALEADAGGSTETNLSATVPAAVGWDSVPTGSGPSPNLRARESLAVGPFLLWVALCLGLPWLAAGWIAGLLRWQSNSANLILVAGYLVAVVLTGWCFWARWDCWWIAWPLLLGMASLWLGYLELVCRCLDRRWWSWW
jgi:hypothetical protein